MLIDPATGRQLKQLTASGTVYAVTFDPTGRRIAAAQADGHVSVWAWDTGRTLDFWAGPAAFENVAFSDDGALVAGASDDDTVSVWNSHTRSDLVDLVGHSDHVNGVAFGPHGVLTSGGDDGNLITWNTKTITSANILQAGRDVTGLSFDARGQLLAAAAGHRVDLFGIGSERHTVLPDEGNATVHTVAFDPDAHFSLGLTIAEVPRCLTLRGTRCCEAQSSGERSTVTRSVRMAGSSPPRAPAVPCPCGMSDPCTQPAP